MPMAYWCPVVKFFRLSYLFSFKIGNNVKELGLSCKVKIGGCGNLLLRVSWSHLEIF